MIDKLKVNTRIKAISLLSAIVLWLYVMAIVDPQERRLYENVAIKITNLNQLENEELVVYPEVNLETDIYLTGKLSRLKNITKEDIHIYGEINDPIEGTNMMFLKANVASGISHDFKNSTIAISLEKEITEEKNVYIELDTSSKNNIEKLTLDKEKIKVTGARSLVQEVDKVVAEINDIISKEDFTKELQVRAVDKNGEEVQGITLEYQTVNVDVKLLREKQVPIKVVFDNQASEEISYTINKDTILLKGKEDILNSIESINTVPIDITTLSNNTFADIELEIPEGVIVDNKAISIKIDKQEPQSKTFVYSLDEIQIRNNELGIDTAVLDLPDTIEVEVKYDLSEKDIIKEDIIIYLDLSEQSQEYLLKYETDYVVNSIDIKPETINVKSE